MIPFNYHHLYYFYGVARLGSVSSAAVELRVSQPALSAQIKQLESHLGVRLFERRGRTLALTEEGRSAFAYARDIFDTGREFLDHIRDRSQKGRVRIQLGVANSVPKAFAAELIRFVLRTDPSAHIELHEDTLESMAGRLKEHGLDLVLSDMPYRVSAEEGFENRLIARVPIAFYAAPRLAARFKRLPLGLDGAPLILPTSQSGVYHAVLEYLSAHRIRPHIVAEVQDVELIQRMAVEGLGVAPLNRFSVDGERGPRVLVALPSGSRHDIHDSVYLISRARKRAHPLVDAILAGFKIRL